MERGSEAARGAIAASVGPERVVFETQVGWRGYSLLAACGWCNAVGATWSRAVVFRVVWVPRL